MSRSTRSKTAPVMEDAGAEESHAPIALVLLAERFPHRQFSIVELALLSGVGKTALSQIKNADDTPFSLGKCSLRRLDEWLAAHPGIKQQ